MHKPDPFVARDPRLMLGLLFGGLFYTAVFWTRVIWSFV